MKNPVLQNVDMPESEEMERALLAAILIDNKAIFEAVAVVQPTDFFSKRHQVVFAAMQKTVDAGRDIEPMTLADRLPLGDGYWRQPLEAVVWLSALLDGFVQSTAATNYALGIRERAQRRRFLQQLDVAVQYAVDPATPLPETVLSLQTSMLDLAGDSDTQQVVSMGDFIEEVYADVELQRLQEGLLGAPTGIEALDRTTTGYRSGELIVIGGRPGDGKSSIALQSALANVAQGWPVMMFSVEMRKDEVSKRMISAYFGIPFSRIRDSRRMTEEDRKTWMAAQAEAAAWPFFIDDSSYLHVQQLAARARLAIRRHKVRLIIVDYVQLLDAKGEDIRARVSAISRTLAQLAKSERVPVMALSQLSRPKDGDRNRRPTMFDLKESGTLEADSHLIVLLYRPLKGEVFTGEDEIIVAKQRSGQVGIEPALFDGKFLTYKPRIRNGGY